MPENLFVEPENIISIDHYVKRQAPPLQIGMTGEYYRSDIPVRQIEQIRLAVAFGSMRRALHDNVIDRTLSVGAETYVNLESETGPPVLDALECVRRAVETCSLDRSGRDFDIQGQISWHVEDYLTEDPMGFTNILGNPEAQLLHGTTSRGGKVRYVSDRASRPRCYRLGLEP